MYLTPEENKLVQDISIIARMFIDTNGITEYDKREALSDAIQNEIDSALVTDYMPL